MKKATICVIIPAYNESANLAILIPRIVHIIPNAAILVVDDSSNQEQTKTKQVCGRWGLVRCISRGKKQGRGSAVLSGMRYALEHIPCSMLLEMDADLAHDPEEILRLCAPIGHADMVVGSRYTKGSKIKKWTVSRIIQSKLINFFLSYWLGIHLTDYTNGFRAYSQRACAYLTRIHLRETGFILLSEMAYRLHQHGFRIQEVPVSFTDRTYGKSNANAMELWRSLIGVIRLRLTKNSLV